MSLASRQQMMLLAFALVVAGMATFAASRMLRPAPLLRATPAPAPRGPGYMVVANGLIQKFTVLDPAMFHLEKRTESAPKEALSSLAEIKGKIATEFIARDEPVKRADLDYPSPKYGLAFVVPPGRRAVTVGVNAVSGVAGVLQPGYRVDVLATFVDLKPNASLTVTRAANQPSATLSVQESDSRTVTLLRDVTLLTYGPRIQHEPGKEESVVRSKESSTAPRATDGAKSGPDASQIENPGTATLLVTPAQAERLVLAAQRARLSLALRGMEEDVAESGPSGVNDTQLLGLPPARPVKLPALASPRPAPAPAPAPRSVPAPAPSPEREIVLFRGTQREIVKVPR